LKQYIKMNQYLKTIQELLQQNMELTEADKEAILKAIADADKQWSITDFKLDRTEKVKKTTAILLEETIEELEQKRKAVEEKNRELEIESSLERVRSQAMSMIKPGDLLAICKTLYEELQALGFTEIRNSMINIHDDDQGSMLNYDFSEISGTTITTILYNSLPVIAASVNQIRKTNDAFAEFSMHGKELDEWREFRKKNGEQDDPRLDKSTGIFYYFYSIGTGALGISTFSAISEEKLKLLKRFRNVFNLSYQRYIDISLAEAQAREAMIELGLERVRARAMAMQQSDELKELIGTVYTELTKLDIALVRCLIWVMDSENLSSRLWMANAESRPVSFFVPYHENPPYLAFVQGWKERNTKWQYDLGGQIKKDWDEFVFHHTEMKHLPEQVKKSMQTTERTMLAASFQNFGCLQTAGPETLKEKQFDILNRFAKVFDLTYTRFNDLQKAEAQAKEAQIEVSLERVRSRSMGMQKSEEFKEVIQVVYAQFVHLNIHIEHTGFIMDYKARDDMHIWLADRHEVPSEVTFPYFDSPHWNSFIEAKEKGMDFFANHLTFEEKNKFYQQLFSLFPVLPDETKDYYFNCPGLAISTVLLDDIGLYIENFSGLPYTDEENNTLMRFGKVFQQTYTRFLDLQKAEVQAREAQIELGLERVRARAMAMQNSEELKELIGTVFTELTKLDLVLTRCVIMIYDHKTKGSTWWMANSEAPSDPIGLFIQYHEHHPYLAYVKAWQEKRIKWTYTLEGKVKKQWDDFLFVETELSNLPDFVIAGMKAPDRVYLNASFNSFGNLTLATIEPLSDEHFDIMLRFAKVFDLTYTRFNDLKQAEAQAREGQIQLALERVRARTMAMQKSSELGDVATVLFSQLNQLVENLWTCGFVLCEKDRNEDEWWLSIENGFIPAFYLPNVGDATHANIFNAWKNGATYHTEQLEGKALEDHYDWLMNMPVTRKIFDDMLAAGFKLPNWQKLHCAYFKTGYLVIITQVPCPEEEIFKRFAQVFDLTYTRFLDLQKAESQTREAKIEVSLERVRSKAMAMHNSRDLAETIKTFYYQIEALSVIPRRLGIGIINKEAHSVELTTMNSTEQGDSIEIIGTLSLTGHPVLEGIFNGWLSQTEYHPVLIGNALKEYYKIVRPQIAYPDYPSNYAQYGYFFFFPEGGVYAWTEQEMSEDELQIYRRFTSVLSLTYKRYKDLKDAESQARESQIQLAMERVRARTMAMQSSEELAETSQLLFEEFNKLNLVSLGDFPDRALIGIPDQSHHKVAFWSTDLKGTGIDYKFEGSIEEPYLFNRTIQAWKNEEKSIVIDLDGIELTAYLDYLKSIGFPVEENHYHRKRIHYFGFFSRGLIGISSACHLPQETIPLLERFAGVFDLTYTRFLDLQKAEAQVRESKIELALERIRARTMAMQRSDELADVAEVLLKQFAVLGNEPERISIGIIDETNGTTDVWATDQAGSQLQIRFKARNDEKTTLKKIVEKWKAGEKSVIVDLQGDELKAWIQYLGLELGMPIRDEQFNDRRLHQVSFFSQGWLNITTLEPVHQEVLSLLDRFAAVFNLTFTRFLDLKKAASQTRQAQIETAMEKVRARSLAMQKPEELKEVAQVLRKEMSILGVEELETCSIYIHHETSGKTECWYAIKDYRDDETKLISDHFILQLEDTWVGRQMLEFYRSDQLKTSIVMQGAKRKEWIEYCTQQSKVISGFYGENIPDRTYHLNKFSNGYLGAASPGDISTESWELLQRATAVFSLAYTRFSDLQKSEASTREAIRQASLDRVRAEIASMRTTIDLERITPLMWKELTTLGVPFIRCGVFIMDEAEQQIHTFLSASDGQAIAAFNSSYHEPGLMAITIPYWRNKEMYKTYWEEADFIEQANTLVRQGAISSPEIYLTENRPTQLYLHFIPFLQGMLYVGGKKPLNEEEIQLVQNLADAFSTAYARYEDFNNLESAKVQIEKTLTDLKQAQTQLIQAEKMASLGQLTAGIAHEIQNPLNFVNNFSEVNRELIEELKAERLKPARTTGSDGVKGERNDAFEEEILNDISQNLQKINHHGKRAEAIVKGMLQHSQAVTGRKEPTDINALADEYLRLAYHGLRAKDKTFNATLKTDFDESLSADLSANNEMKAEGSAKAGIGLIEVVGQDIARAILNLITNAFYAVQEKDKKMKLEGVPFAPMISVTTKRSGKTVEIRVKDNGPGIPQHILDKIFQPFFTTKPTGQGTGLGLSLSYDIVKGHGGDLKVETKEGEGSEFIIQLPVV